MTKSLPSRRRPVCLTLAAMIVLSGCIVSKDDAAKKAADSAALAAATPDMVDISVPAYDSVSADTVGLGSQMADTSSLPTDSSLARLTPKAVGSRPAAF